MSSVLVSITTVLYGFAAFGFIYRFVQRTPEVRQLTLGLLGAAWLTHVAALVVQSMARGALVLVTLSDILSAVALVLALVYLCIDLGRHTDETGAFVVALVFGIQACSAFFYSTPTGDAAHQPAWFVGHLVGMIAGYAGFALGAVYGVMFLLLYRALKVNQFGILFQRLPPLESLGVLSLRATLVGWITLTVSLGLGWARAATLGGMEYSDPHIVTMSMVWLIYAVTMLTHYVLGVQGAGVVGLGLAGFGIAIFGLAGQAFLWSSSHPFLY